MISAKNLNLINKIISQTGKKELLKTLLLQPPLLLKEPHKHNKKVDQTQHLANYLKKIKAYH